MYFMPKTLEIVDVIPGKEPMICMTKKDMQDLSIELNQCRSKPGGF